jgi:hypothetical protein
LDLNREEQCSHNYSISRVACQECTSAEVDRRPSFDELDRRTIYLESTIKIGTSKKTRAADTALLEEVFPKHIAQALREGRSIGMLSTRRAGGLSHDQIIEAENHPEVTIFFSGKVLLVKGTTLSILTAVTMQISVGLPT